MCDAWQKMAKIKWKISNKTRNKMKFSFFFFARSSQLQQFKNKSLNPVFTSQYENFFKIPFTIFRSLLIFFSLRFHDCIAASLPRRSFICVVVVVVVVFPNEFSCELQCYYCDWYVILVQFFVCNGLCSRAKKTCTNDNMEKNWSRV